MTVPEAESERRTEAALEALGAAAKASKDAAFIEIVQVSVADLQQRIGLKANFLDELDQDGDDWSFVVKSHALLEAALNEAVVNALGRRSIEKRIERMPVANKVEWASDLGLLLPDSRSFLQKFSDIRNKCIHNVANVSFSFRNYLGELQAREREALMKAASLGNFVVFTEDDFNKDPRAVIAAALKGILSLLNLKSQVHWMNQSFLRLYLMCKPASELPQGLWAIAKEAAPDI